ncbi:UNVERIFIED_ORG: hypothetical protein [Escherichia phage CMSTMSU]
MQMKILSPSEYHELLSSLILKLYIAKTTDLPDEEKIF